MTLADVLAIPGVWLVALLVIGLLVWAHATQRAAEQADVDKDAWGVRHFDAHWDRR